MAYFPIAPVNSSLASIRVCTAHDTKCTRMQDCDGNN